MVAAHKADMWIILGSRKNSSFILDYPETYDSSMLYIIQKHKIILKLFAVRLLEEDMAN